MQSIKSEKWWDIITRGSCKQSAKGKDKASVYKDDLFSVSLET